MLAVSLEAGNGIKLQVRVELEDRLVWGLGFRVCGSVKLQSSVELEDRLVWGLEFAV